jgi:hypothetical protein
MNAQNITRDGLEGITSSEFKYTRECHIYRQMQEMSLRKKSSNALDSLKHHHGGTICFWKIVLEYHHGMQRFQVFMMKGKKSRLHNNFYYLLF